MQRYIGTEIIVAEPMTRGEYCGHRNWRLPDDEDPTDDGYLVEHADGHESWSPGGNFQDTHRRTDNMNFSLALEAMRQGERVARVCSEGGVIYQLTKGQFLAEFVAEKVFANMWGFTPEDMFADDWYIVGG